MPFNPNSSNLFVIAGPCVIESQEQCLRIGEHMKKVCDKLGLTYVFKASFDKANRSSVHGFRGPGLTDGLVVLERVKRELGVPVLTDVHEVEQAAIAAKVVDILQVPAFLARQTDLLIACAHTGKAINVKKGQFMSPAEMKNVIEKIRESALDDRVSGLGIRDSENQSPKPDTPTPKPVFLTERGTFFGYNRLVNDFTGLSVMKDLGVPVIFEITHSTQQPAGMGTQSGGNPQFSQLLARAAIATGCVDGLFLECHPDPKNAKSDAATVLNLTEVEPILSDCVKIHQIVRSR